MNTLPDHVMQTIEELVSQQSLKGHYDKLSAKYRYGQDKQLSGKKEHLAYLASRLPATYAVNIEVIHRLLNVAPTFCPRTVLDVGAGPGTALLALANSFTTIEEALLVEKNSEFIELGKKFVRNLPASWQTSVPNNLSFDLVISSYMLTEIDQNQLQEILQAMMHATGSYIVLIDNGTPKGYETLMQARDKLIEKGFFIHAPCPHQKKCPMYWCHFVSRLPRSHLHRQVKRWSAALKMKNSATLSPPRSQRHKRKAAS